MPLQHKVSLALVVLIAAFVILSYTILQSIIAPAFDELEMDSAISDLYRAEAALKTDIENLEAITADWAPWDDIYYYVSGINPGFQKSNLDRPTLENLGLDLMAIYSTESRFVWGQVLVDGNEVPVDSLNILNPSQSISKGLVAHAAGLDKTVGVVQTVHGPMIISSRPILKSDDSGPIAGAVIMGQLLNAERLERLRERTNVQLGWSFSPTPDDAIGDTVFVAENQTLLGRKVFGDIHGEPLLVLTSNSARSISTLGARTINAATSFLIVAGVLVCAFIWFMLRFMILTPIKSLTTHIDQIRESGDLSRQIELQRTDEIGVLGRQFNSMTADVHDARQALLEQSFKAGKADTAAEVMHNIRNAMTPMINALDRLRRCLGVSGKLRVREAADQLASDDCPPQRKAKFLEYIRASFERIETVTAEATDDLNLATAQAKQVEAIISDQEKFTNVAPVAENIVVDELLEEAANVIPKESPKSVEVMRDKDLDKLRVQAHRIGLLQVLGNLILNAYESIRRSGRPKGEIALMARDELIDDKPMIRVTIRDNGSGFDDETKQHIFQRGFTSKTRGETTGLGLHWCANAVAGMGGRISAESDGDGKGAEFHVLLPAAQGG